MLGRVTTGNISHLMSGKVMASALQLMLATAASDWMTKWLEWLLASWSAHATGHTIKTQKCNRELGEWSCVIIQRRHNVERAFIGLESNAVMLQNQMVPQF